MNICKAVYDKVKELENRIGPGATKENNQFQDIDNAMSTFARENHGIIPSHREFYGFFVKILMGFIFAIGLLYVIIVLDWS